MFFRYLMVIVVSVIFSAPVSAQFTGPGTGGGGGTTVKEVLGRAPDDAWVTLRGRITQKVGHEKYLFTDGTDQITVDIDDKYFQTIARLVAIHSAAKFSNAPVDLATVRQHENRLRELAASQPTYQTQKAVYY